MEAPTAARRLPSSTAASTTPSSAAAVTSLCAPAAPSASPQQPPAARRRRRRSRPPSPATSAAARRWAEPRQRPSSEPPRAADAWCEGMRCCVQAGWQLRKQWASLACSSPAARRCPCRCPYCKRPGQAAELPDSAVWRLATLCPAPWEVPWRPERVQTGMLLTS